MNKTNSLIIFTKAALMLAEADTIQKAKELKNLALTAADWAKRKGMGEQAILHARSYALRAERKMGEMLANKDLRQKPGEYQKSQDVTFVPKSSLADLGLTKNESARAQKLATIDAEKFEDVIEGKKTRAATENEAAREKKREELKVKSLIPGEKKYRIIYADPPWDYSQWLPHKYGDVKKIYPTMTIEQISEMPVGEICDKDSVLFLWATSPKLEQAFSIIRAWGFEYKTSFVWDKVKHNFGYYNSMRHELLLIGGRGSSTPDSRKLHDSVISLERSDVHSEKPGLFRDLIDELYKWGNRIELFHRGIEIKKGWDIWGNE